MRLVRTITFFWLGWISTLLAADLPEFRALVDDELFEFEFEDLCERIQLEKWAKTAKSIPADAAVIEELVPEGWAESNGLEPGDAVLSIDGHLSWHQSIPWPSGDNRKLKLRRKNGKVETFDLPYGKMGVYLVCPAELGREMVHRHSPDTPGYRFVLGAIGFAHLNPNMAETALHKAVAAGYQPDAVSSNIAARIALRQNRPGDAWAYVRQMLGEVDSLEKLAPSFRPSALRAAYANGKLRFLLDANQAWGGNLFSIDQDQLAKLKMDREHGWDPKMRPSQRLADLSLRERTMDRKFVKGLRGSGTFPNSRNTKVRMEIRRGFFRTSYVSLPNGVGDFIWEMDLDCNATALQGVRRFRPLHRFGIFQLAEERDDDVLLARMDLFQLRSEYGLGIGAVDSQINFETEWGFAAGMEPMNIRFIRLGDEIEVQLDGATLIWMPCVENRDLGFRMSNSGMTVEYHRHRLWEVVR